jgi:hypothetical protein
MLDGDGQDHIRSGLLRPGTSVSIRWDPLRFPLQGPRGGSYRLWDPSPLSRCSCVVIPLFLFGCPRTRPVKACALRRPLLWAVKRDRPKQNRDSDFSEPMRSFGDEIPRSFGDECGVPRSFGDNESGCLVTPVRIDFAKNAVDEHLFYERIP